MKEKQQRNLGLVAIAFHLIGVVGTLYPPTSALTVSLTPYNLLLSALLILVTHAGSGPPLYYFAAIAFAIGFGVEVLGVATGAIFGEYEYGPTLGWSLAGVPLTIGINWFVLSYCFAELSNRLQVPTVARVLIAAAGMVLLDILIEPVAIRLDYWQWAEDLIPVQNFIGWFAVAVVIQIIGRRLLGIFHNQLTIFLIISQIMYFCLILVFYN